MATALSGCGSAGSSASGSSAPSPLASPEGSTAASTVASPSAESSSSPRGGPSPSAALFVTGTPEPGDADAAISLVHRYETALVDHQWAVAWSLLAPDAQTLRHSLADFEYERSAFMASAGDRYSLGAPVHDLAVFEQWMPVWRPASADLGRAFIVRVDYPALANNNAGWSMLLAAPNPAGHWYLWELR